MACCFSKQRIEDVISFHGHSCPGLAIGIRASELAMRELGNIESHQMVAVSETDMCGVDAIQFLTGCTYGKGNFIHRDYGKMAFSFFDRVSGHGIRALLKPEARAGAGKQLDALMVGNEHSMSDAHRQRIVQLKLELQQQIMNLTLDELFEVTPLNAGMPRPAQIMKSIVCEHCGESVMESRIRRFSGKFLCIPCFATMEQKL